MCEKGWRPAFPPKTPEVLQQLISHCWAEKREDRPSFTDLRGPLTSLLKATQLESGYGTGTTPNPQAKDADARAEALSRIV